MQSRGVVSLVVTAVAAVAAACEMLEESEYANCAIAGNASAFIGEWLRHDGSAVVSRQL
jgi:hypothetical protein